MADAKPKTGAKPSKRVLEKKQKKRGGNGDEPTKDEYAVAKFVRFKCPTKKTMFAQSGGGDEVHYFVGSKAVDCLMESKYSATSKKASKKNQLFVDRQSCVDYMQQLLMKGLFFRAKKLVPKIKDKKTEAGEKKKDPKKGGAETKEEATKSPKAGKEEATKSPKTGKDTEVKRRKKDKAQKDEEEEKAEKDKDDDDNRDKGKEKSSKSRKIRLDFHAEQLFIDGPSIYVWKYDPTSLNSFLLGLGIVLGAIALCLFPLWPLQVRAGVYYLSLGAMGFFGAFIGLVVLRSVLFGVVWAVSLGRRRFWLLPNLTEDCGVLESFKPWYSHKYLEPGTKPVDEKKKKKDKKSDSEDEGSPAEEEKEESAAEEEHIREDDQAEDRASEIGTDNEDDQENQGISGTASQDDDEIGKSDASTNESASVRTSTEEEPQSSQQKPQKKRKAARRDDVQDVNNGDFELVDKPIKDD